MFRFLCFLCLFFSCCKFSAAQNQNIVFLSTPKSQVVLYEPIFVNISGSLNNSEELKFEILINGKIKKGIDPEVLGLQDIHIIADKTNNLISITAYWVFCYDVYHKRYLFENPGQYTIQIAEKSTGAVSNELTFIVNPLDSKDSEAAKLFVGTDQIMAIYTDEPAESGEKFLRKLFNEYPNSVFSPYISFILLKREGEIIIRKRITSKEDQIKKFKSLGALANKYSLAKRIPSPSQWHGEALLELAQFHGLSGDYKTANSLLKRITYIYTSSIIFGEAKEMLKEIEQIDKK